MKRIVKALSKYTRESPERNMSKKKVSFAPEPKVGRKRDRCRSVSPMRTCRSKRINYENQDENERSVED